MSHAQSTLQISPFLLPPLFSQTTSRAIGRDRATQRVEEAAQEEEKAWLRLGSVLDAAINALAIKQLAAVFWESSCELVVFKDELWKPRMVTSRQIDDVNQNSQDEASGAVRVVYDGPLSLLEAFSFCSQAGDASWTWSLPK